MRVKLPKHSKIIWARNEQERERIKLPIIPIFAKQASLNLAARKINTMITEQILAEITERLVDKFHPHQIILFGSQARRIADDRSQ
ncbi:hypothetical protein KKB18_12670 [bacterium]|nr:hypothetical protein [bacterium]